jgi:hypothetical protein
VDDLPFVDEHCLAIRASRERVWTALVSYLGRRIGGRLVAPLTPVLGLRPAQRRGGWALGVAAGDSVPGFEVAESEPPCRLELQGQHRFSRYALVFRIDATAADASTICAETWAEFPGLTGRAYRAMVIGSGAHALLVPRLLKGVARRA